MLECKGACSNSSHKFIAAVTNYICPVCKDTVCHLCTGKINKIHHCLPCYLMESILPGFNTSDMMTITQMRDELKRKYNFDKVDQLNIEDVEDVYLSYSLHRHLEVLSEAVEFPKHPASAIKSGECWEEIAEIDFSFGGSFLLNENIVEQRLPAILELFASFV